LLQRSAEVNAVADRIRVVHAAAADTAGVLKFDSTGSVTGHVTAKGEEEVPAMTLSSLLECYCNEADSVLIKLDIEGFETRVLPTLSKTPLPETCTLVVELHPQGFNGVGDPKACFTWLQEIFASVGDIHGQPVEIVDSNQFYQIVASNPYGR
jgi:FkbM family methyltransferase